MVCMGVHASTYVKRERGEVGWLCMFEQGSRSIHTCAHDIVCDLVPFKLDRDLVHITSP